MPVTNALKEARELVKKGRFVLIGTMALRLRGLWEKAEDIDFLCEHAPGGNEDGTGSGGSTKIKSMTGYGINFIYADKARRKFLTRRPDVILGIPVASLDDVLGIKRFAGRPKDLRFLQEFERAFPGGSDACGLKSET